MQVDESNRRNRKRGVEKRVDAAARVEEEIDDGQRERESNLRTRAARRRLRIGDHVEHEQEERRGCERAENQRLRRQVPPHQVGAQENLQRVEEEERYDQWRAPDFEDEEEKRRGDEERRHAPRSSPLIRGRRADQVPADDERHRDAEHRWVEDVPSLERQHVFRSDREPHRQEQQEAVVRVVEEQRERRAGDERAERHEPPFVDDAAEEDVERARARDGDEHLQRRAVESENGAAEDGVKGEDGGERDAWIDPHVIPSGARDGDGDFGGRAPAQIRRYARNDITHSVASSTYGRRSSSLANSSAPSAKWTANARAQNGVTGRLSITLKSGSRSCAPAMK